MNDSSFPFRLPHLPVLLCLLTLTVCLVPSAYSLSQQPLFVVYPPPKHETTANRIFLIGTAPVAGQVMVNGQAIARSSAGHFAPSFPLQVGKNSFILRYDNQELQITVTRLSGQPELPAGLGFAQDSLTPKGNLTRQPNEPLCFSAIASTKATVSVKLANQTIPLQLQAQSMELPPNSAVLTQQNQPQAIATAGTFQGCTRIGTPGDLGNPEFQLTLDGKTHTQQSPGSIQILSPTKIEIAQVTADSGIVRTGPSTDFSRMTPLPKGTRASITATEGDWLRLDYGAWIRRSEVQVTPGTASPTSWIRSLKGRSAGDWTEIVFPLQVPVPVRVQQGSKTFTLTLYNTTAQTDTIRLDDDPLIQRLDWQQSQPGQVQYTFNLKTNQQWGYRLHYEGTSLILGLKHPSERRGQPVQGRQKAGNSNSPTPNPQSPLSGITILLDPGHGGPEDLGARGPTGYPEKKVTLEISKLVRSELQNRGATVVMTREQDVDVSLQARVAMIDKTQPAIALSLHYNALPDNGDAVNTQGISTFWYHPQAHSLAVFLHNYLTTTLNRSSYGVYWNNLALTRPSTTPSVLLELGFMIHPNEFEWIINPSEQKKLAGAITNGITRWFAQTN
jgi:N-acetylmuramoyl-L-alanine amidase